MSDEVNQKLLENSGDRASQPVFTKKVILFGVGVFLVIAVTSIVAGVVISISVAEANATPSFGFEMRDKMFLLESGRTFLNHGSYGNTPIVTQERETEWRKLMERNTDLWFRETFKKEMPKVQEKLAKFVGAKSTDLILLDNASTAVNAVFRSFPFTEKDVIGYLNFIYGMVQKTIEYVCSRTGARYFEIKIPFPTNETEIIQLIEKGFDEGNVTFFSISHITSVPALIMPVKKIIEIAKKRNITVLVDGAHSVGQIPLNLTDIDADFYLSNGHKWLLSPKGSSFLHVKEKHQKIIHPTVISFGYQLGFLEEFEWTGTRDMSAWMTIGDAIDFRNTYGTHTIPQYNNELAHWAVHTLARLWKTTPPQSDDMFASLGNVQLPCNVKNETQCYNYDHIDLNTQISKEYKINFVTFEFNNKYYTRLSAQIYNYKEEYERLGKAVLEITKPF